MFTHPEVLVESILASTSSDWSLLQNILSVDPKPWLPSLVHRLPPLTNLILSFLNDHDPVLIDPFAKSLILLFPLASKRITLDGLAEILWSLWRLLGSQRDQLTIFFEIVLVEYKRAFGVASVQIKKKAYNNFVQSYLDHWINAVVLPSSLILSVGIDTLLSVDVLRFTDCHLSHDSTSKHVHLIDRLEELLNGEKIVFLPIFYASYLQALYRYRSQLFGHPGGGRYRETACAFLRLLLGLLDRVEAPPPIVWRTRADLLSVLWTEGGYVAGDQPEESKGPRDMLMNVVHRVVGVFDESGSNPPLKPLAIQSLSTIIRIDYDIVKPFVPQILVRVLVQPLDDDVRPGIHKTGPFTEFLDLLLDCHVKTRSLDDLVGVILQSVWEGRLGLKRQGLVVEDDLFLDRLGRAIRTFGTMGQCVGLLGCVETFGQRCLTTLEGLEEDVEMDEMEEGVGLRLQLAAKVVCVVLTFFPFEMVFSSSEGEGKERLELLKNMKSRVDCVVGRLVKGLCDGFLDLHRGLCALLRLKYVLDRDVFGAIGLGLSAGRVKDETGDEVLEALVLFLECEIWDDDEEIEPPLLPELVFEMVRTTFLHLSTKKILEIEGSSVNKGHERFFDALLAFVEIYYLGTKTESGWSGKDYDLTLRGTAGQTQRAIAIVWMTVERWLSEIDSLATSKQIRRWLDIVFKVDLAGKEIENKRGLVTPESILLNALHSAWFWELGRVRKELIELLREKTSPGIDLSRTISTFRVLLYFPLEYFSFQVLSGFVGCAVEVDENLIGTWQRAGSEKGSRQEVMQGLVVLRVFMKRACVYVGGGSVLDFRGKNEAELLLRMLEEPVLVDDGLDVDGSVKEEYLSASLGLAEVWLARLLKASKKASDPVAVLPVLKSFNLDSLCGRGGRHKRPLTSECFIRMVELLDREVGLGQPNSGAGVYEEVGRALRVLRDELVEGLYVRIMKEVSREGLEDDWKVREYSGLVRVWDGLICLGRSVFDDDECQQGPFRFVADKLISVLMPHVQSRDDGLDGSLAELCVAVFSALVGEMEYRNRKNRNGLDCNGGGEDGEGRRLRYLEVVVAIYVSLANKVSATGLTEMEVRLGRMAKRLALSDFEHLLSFVAESLSDANVGHTKSGSRLTQLVHLGSLLIRDHPSHSLACIQKFMARCLGLFTDDPVYVEGDLALRLRVLELVGQYCSDQHAALRAHDTSLIWLLISKFLSPSQVHDSDTRTDIFHKIVSILTCLVRLRRDLVTLGLPHLGLILRKLVMALRGCRPNLGAKQMAIVMNTQPRWISHARSLGGEEAKALCRLLESLALKTTVRLAFSSDASSSQKAESLGKPFSKHAAYVLKAYVESMNDPLCVMSLEVRREMREGLFALCGMMGVYVRDALMVGGGLDVGGKAVLKAVWKDWEEVRYVGKG